MPSNAAMDQKLIISGSFRYSLYDATGGRCAAWNFLWPPAVVSDAADWSDHLGLRSTICPVLILQPHEDGKTMIRYRSSWRIILPKRSCLLRFQPRYVATMCVDSTIASRRAMISAILPMNCRHQWAHFPTAFSGILDRFWPASGKYVAPDQSTAQVQTATPNLRYNPHRPFHVGNNSGVWSRMLFSHSACLRWQRHGLNALLNDYSVVAAICGLPSSLTPSGLICQKLTPLSLTAHRLSIS